MNRCNICLNYKCDHTIPCNCDAYDKMNECPRWLRPTIRITTKCTQSCSHCCFRCSPGCDDFMSEGTAIKINTFLINNDITHYLNIMGGEFFCHPKWENIIDALIKGIVRVRIVSNGDWAGKKSLSKKVIKFLKTHPTIIMCVSNDKFHDDTNIYKAIELLKKHDIPNDVQKDEGTDWLIPVGRASFEYTPYGSISCFCRGENHSYEFLIDEVGKIYKCPYGIWEYDFVDNFLNGGFDVRFKQFGRAFRSVWISSCTACARMYHRSQYTVEKGCD